MAMFPVFIIGLFAGILLSYAYYHCIKSVPSNTKFKLQEETITRLKEDIEALELTNAELCGQIEELKRIKKRRKKKE